MLQAGWPIRLARRRSAEQRSWRRCGTKLSMVWMRSMIGCRVSGGDSDGGLVDRDGLPGLFNADNLIA